MSTRQDNFEAELQVNDVSVELNPFVEQFLARTVLGAVSSLKRAEDIRKLGLYIRHGDVRIIVNDNELPLTPFPKEIFANTLIGLVSSLKEVGKIDSLNISVEIR